MFLILELYKFRGYFFFVFGFLYSIITLDFTIYFCDDNIINEGNNEEIKEENWLFTNEEIEDFKVIWSVFLNSLKIVIFLFSLAGFSILALCCILVFDIANAHRYGRPTD